MFIFYTFVDQRSVCVCVCVFYLFYLFLIIFFKRYECGLVDTHLATNHHHNVLVKLQIDVDSIGQKYSFVNGTFTVVNKRHQVIAHQWTYSTNNKEREPLAQDLCNFFYIWVSIRRSNNLLGQVL